MKFNQWTLGLAAVGVISLASAARAEESAVPLLTALSPTTISGYVDTSFEWTLDRTDPYYSDGVPQAFDSWGHVPYRTASKQNGFNLNVVKLSIAKAMDESEWASGYKIDLLFGPDAVNYNPSAESISGQGGYHARDFNVGTDFAIKNAYVALRTPVGNGIDWKVGVFDSIIGYESFEAGNNPNFSRSWGYAIEPTQHTGILATYRFCDCFSAAVGIANTLMPGINTRNIEFYPDDIENTDNLRTFWRKTYMASVAATAPESWGFLSGSTLYAGVVGGFAGGTEDQHNYYVGATMNTPVTGLKAGIALDYVDHRGGRDGNDSDAYDNGEYRDDAWAVGLYASYQATEKLSLHARAEYGDNKYSSSSFNDYGSYVHWDSDRGHEKILALTGTVQYDLWKNVISRVEFRWDQMQTKGTDKTIHQNIGEGGGEPFLESYDSYKYVDATAVGVYANIIYKF